MSSHTRYAIAVLLLLPAGLALTWRGFTAGGFAQPAIYLDAILVVVAVILGWLFLLWKSQVAAEAQRQGQQHTRLIVDTALDAVVTMRESGVITDWNVQAEKIFGWSRAEAIGRRMTETIIPPQYRDAHERGLKKFLETGEGPVLNRRIEITAINRDGREFPVELAISPARLGDDWIFSAFIRDLTERNRAEDALREGERRYRELYENMPVGLYRTAPDGRILDANAAMVSLLGYPDLATLLATGIPSLYVNPEDRVRWSEEVAKKELVRDFEFQLRRRDGGSMWARDTARAKLGPDGAVVYYEGALEDMSESVESARALHASERRLVQILEAVPLGVYVTDGVGRVVFVNVTAQKLLGRSIVPVETTDLAAAYQMFLTGTDDPYPAERLPIVRALKGEMTSVDDVEIRRGTDTTSLAVHGAPILDSGGKVVAAVAAFMDITAHKRLEDQLRQSSKMEAVGQLAGGIAHDFNNLLTVIISYSSLLIESLDQEGPHRADVEEISAAADRAAGLTRQLLAFSRKQVIQPRVVSLNAVISAVEKMLRRLIGEDIQLETRLDPGLALINADPGQLEQLLLNLVVNARDAMPRGGAVSLSTANSELSADSRSGPPEAADGRYVMLVVSDTGSGMTPEVERRAFEPFFTTKERGRGTGLGLSTVYGIVKQSGGHISVDSEPGRGTTISVRFPQYSASGVRVASEVSQKEAPGGSETILLAEDDTALRSLAVRILKGRGYEVLVAQNGVEAIAIAAKHEGSINLVVTDVVMPAMSGRQLVETLLETRSGVKVLLMSGYTDDEVMRRGVLEGQTAFLQKPFTPDQLAHKVREVLDRGAT